MVNPGSAHPLRRDDVPLPRLGRGSGPASSHRSNAPSRQRRVTYDFERLMSDSTLLKTSEFAAAMVENM